MKFNAKSLDLLSLIIGAAIIACLAAYVVYAVPSLALASLERPEPLINPGTIRSSTKYQLKTHRLLQDSARIQRLLIVRSIYPKNSPDHLGAVKKIEVLLDVLESHWGVLATIKDEAQYQEGDLVNYDALFYIKEYNNDKVPQKLLDDILSTKTKPIIWSGYYTDAFTAGVLGKNVSEFKKTSFSQKAEIGRILYSGVEFDTAGLTYLQNLRWPRNPRIKVFAELKTYKSIGSTIYDSWPFIIEINDHILLLPFELPYYYKSGDYTSVFLDVLHTAIGSHKSPKTALLRLEDINNYTYLNTSSLDAAHTYLSKEDIPFHLAMIPLYRNPDQELTMPIGQTRNFLRTIKSMVSSNLGVLVQHGYTHQLRNEISGIGFEFWDGINNKPIADDNQQYFYNLISNAKLLMKEADLPVPDIWETPHYAMSDNAEKAIRNIYPVLYEHVPKWGSFHFPVEIDGTIYIPETLGYVHSGLKDITKMEKRLGQLAVLNDAVPSFFWHPWRNLEELKYLTKLIRNAGFTFVRADKMLDSQGPQGYLTAQKLLKSSHLSSSARHLLLDLIIAGVYLCFLIGAFLYLRNIYRIRRYLRTEVDKYSLNINTLRDEARMRGKALPYIAIFVPARNEAEVIENTLVNLSTLDYPKDRYKIFVIVDERENFDPISVRTKDIVETFLQQTLPRKHRELINCIEVPDQYSGCLFRPDLSPSLSTKGRALNYTLERLIEEKSCCRPEIIGVLDADGRLDNEVLKEVAYKRLIDNTLLLQGPVLQISNFDKVSMVGVAAGLELAAHHLSELPASLLGKSSKPQFLAGTNYFIDTETLVAIGGWRQDSLVEDAELSLRLYAEKGIRGAWLSRTEIEQTPPNFSVYRKQRERWARGHLGLIPYLWHAPLRRMEKLRYLNRILSSIYRVVLDLGLPIIAWCLALSGLLLDQSSAELRYLSILLTFLSFFVWDTYGYVYRRIAQRQRPRNSRLKTAALSVKLYCFVPIFILIQIIPKLEALLRIIFQTPRKQWYKTERTIEAIAY